MLLGAEHNWAELASMQAGSTNPGGNNQALQYMALISMPKEFAERWQMRVKNGSLNGELNPARPPKPTNRLTVLLGR